MIFMQSYYQNYLIRDWQPGDRINAAKVIETVLREYGLPWEPEEADQDVLKIEQFYTAVGGEFWVVELQEEIVGTAAYYPISRGDQAVEIRKMYLLPTARKQGLGTYLLDQLESTIVTKGFQEIWIETATVLKEAILLYESKGYLKTTGVETKRCDRVYVKRVSY
jgi:putative acetyltransferase